MSPPPLPYISPITVGPPPKPPLGGPHPPNPSPFPLPLPQSSSSPSASLTYHRWSAPACCPTPLPHHSLPGQHTPPCSRVPPATVLWLAQLRMLSCSGDIRPQGSWKKQETSLLG